MPLNRRQIEDQLRRLEIPEGTSLMVHAGLRRIGPIEGGADTLLDALEGLVGPTGTLLMLLAADDSEPFDCLKTPADPEVGVLAEVFRRRPGTKVNDHPAARFAARGPLARRLLEPVPLHDYYGPGSVLQRFAGAGGYVLRLGADLDTVTLTHYAEYLAPVPDKIRVRRHYERAGIGSQHIDSLDDTDGIVRWAGNYFPRVLEDFLAAGHASTATLGHAKAELLAAPAFVAYAVRWLTRHLGDGPASA